MTRRPRTLDEVDWEAATDAFVKAARNMTLAEIHDRAEKAAETLERLGKPAEAQTFRRVAATIRKRTMN